jgi:DMSO/TMAO reductase YedYZ molybdopterin-dependent catalytic subunit
MSPPFDDLAAEAALERAKEKRRRFLGLAAGGAVAALGGWNLVAGRRANAAARAEKLADGRPRLPPGQDVITYLKDMGGREGEASRADFQLKVHGLVEKELLLNFEELLAFEQVEQKSDVHCVTGWSLLGRSWTGVRIRDLARAAGVSSDARYVIFECEKGYTANVLASQALADDALVAHRFEGKPLSKSHGAPARALLPQLYFWKSAKWITGIRFDARDWPGYWEVRGYHNRADPWKEQRHA